MAQIAFDVEAFRAQFPQFADPATYPDITLIGYSDFASAYVSRDTYGTLTVAQRTIAFNLMTAHLAQMAINIANNSASGGGAIGFQTSASIDKVSYTMNAPPASSQFDYWLTLTGYGQQLKSLLSVATVGGYYVGGIPEGLAFRKGFGRFA